MRRIVLSFSLVVALALLVALSAVPAFAATSTAHHTARANAPSVGLCYTSPSEANCDKQDPYTEGCNTISYLQGGDPWYLQVYYATDSYNHCQSNWGVAWAPNNEYTQEVWLQAKDGRVLYYCTSVAVSSGPCFLIAKDGLLTAVIPNGYQSWHTDMLYAPHTQVRIYEMWSPNSSNLNGASSGYSNWH